MTPPGGCRRGARRDHRHSALAPLAPSRRRSRGSLERCCVCPAEPCPSGGSATFARVTSTTLSLVVDRQTGSGYTRRITAPRICRGQPSPRGVDRDRLEISAEPTARFKLPSHGRDPAAPADELAGPSDNAPTPLPKDSPHVPPHQHLATHRYDDDRLRRHRSPVGAPAGTADADPGCIVCRSRDASLPPMPAATRSGSSTGSASAARLSSWSTRSASSVEGSRSLSLCHSAVRSSAQARGRPATGFQSPTRVRLSRRRPSRTPSPARTEYPGPNTKP